MLRFTFIPYTYITRQYYTKVYEGEGETLIFKQNKNEKLKNTNSKKAERRHPPVSNSSPPIFVVHVFYD